MTKITNNFDNFIKQISENYNAGEKPLLELSEQVAATASACPQAAITALIVRAATAEGAFVNSVLSFRKTYPQFDNLDKKSKKQITEALVAKRVAYGTLRNYLSYFNTMLTALVAGRVTPADLKGKSINEAVKLCRVEKSDSKPAKKLYKPESTIAAGRTIADIIKCCQLDKTQAAALLALLNSSDPVESVAANTNNAGVVLDDSLFDFLANQPKKPIAAEKPSAMPNLSNPAYLM